MAEIFMIRHGQASFGTDNYDQLSELGYEQGRLLGEHFLSLEQKFSTLIAGGLARQQQTAQAVIDVYRKAGVDIPALEIDPRWDELENFEQVQCLLPELLEQKPELKALAPNIQQDKKAFQKVLREVFNYWIIDQPAHPQLESWPAARSRYSDALKQVMENNGRGQQAAVFTSGGVIAAITSIVMKLGPESVYGLFEPVINASVSRFVHSREQISLSSFNEHRFLSQTAASDSVITYR